VCVCRRTLSRESWYKTCPCLTASRYYSYAYKHMYEAGVPRRIFTEGARERGSERRRERERERISLERRTKRIRQEEIRHMHPTRSERNILFCNFYVNSLYPEKYQYHSRKMWVQNKIQVQDSFYEARPRRTNRRICALSFNRQAYREIEHVECIMRMSNENDGARNARMNY